MYPELDNIRSQYPFVYGQTSNSALVALMQSVRCIQLCIYSQLPLQAFVTAYSGTGLTIRITELTSSYNFDIQADSGGNFAAHLKLDSRNSFVLFSNNITTSGTCNLLLLPLVLQQLPKGLRLILYSHRPGSTANYSDSNAELIAVSEWLNLLSGYNCEASVILSGLLFTAAAGLGLGSPSAHYMRHLTQSSVDYLDSYFAGVKTVNGISDKLHIEVSGSMWLTIDSKKGVTTLGINRSDEGTNDTP